MLDEAERGRRRLVSVLIGKAALPIGFGSVQAIDLIGWEGGRREGIEALTAAIAKTLERPPQRAPRVPASRTQKRGIALAAGLVVALGAGALILPRLSQSPPWMNQEIILDSSLGMNEAFDSGMSKLNAATGELGKLFFPVEDNLALRAFGGPCDNEGASRLLVPFGTNRRDRSRARRAGSDPRRRDTAGGCQLRADRHSTAAQYKTSRCDHRPCRQVRLRGPDSRAQKELASLPKTAGQKPVELEMRFIGLGVPAEDAPKIREISDTVGGQSYFVNTVAELKDVLQYVLEFEPAVAHVKNVWSIVDEVGKSMSGVAQNMNAGKVDDATSVLDRSRPVREHAAVVRLAGWTPAVSQLSTVLQTGLRKPRPSRAGIRRRSCLDPQRRALEGPKVLRLRSVGQEVERSRRDSGMTSSASTTRISTR